ncbi:DUF6468 domain-containing protein [Lacibacterium aquatile]|uniref:DUF6468 domain-containing protein n=1 Tax=Lacibacterium aquatile TaxID=1168082 RepID=A0ABW5DMI6_9PROT
MPQIGLILDVVVAVLLVATLFYCVRLNRRLNVIREHRGELEALIQAFNESCTRAELGVRSLRSATDEATRLQQYLERSQNLRDDLSYLMDRGGSLADRLEGGVRTARTAAPSNPMQMAAPAAPAAQVPAAAPRASDRLRERTAGVRQAPMGSEPVPVAPPAPAAPAAEVPAGGAAPRSRAERELLQALRARR